MRPRGSEVTFLLLLLLIILPANYTTITFFYQKDQAQDNNLINRHSVAGRTRTVARTVGLLLLYMYNN